MKRSLLFALLAASAVASAESLTLSDRADEWVDTVQRALTLHQSDTDFIRRMKLGYREQFQVADMQPSGRNGQHLKKGASPVNQEFRRTYLLLDADAASGTTFHTIVRVGGLPVRETYADGRTKKNYYYAGLYELCLKQKIAAVEGLKLVVGKYDTMFTTDYITSSAKILCPERSMLSNQFDQDAKWGVTVEYNPTKTDAAFAQLFLNDFASGSKSRSHGDDYRDGRGLKGEFGYEDKCSAIIGGSHKFRVTETGYQELSAQYVHDFNNAYNDRRDPGANNASFAFRDAVSLGYTVKQDKLTVLCNLVSALEQQSGHGSNNIGLQVQPVYSLTPHIDLVTRWVGMTGRGACKLGGDRYICTQTTAPRWVDSLHSFYVGADLYASAKNSHALKLMLGAEFVTARYGGSDCYNGWEYITALRWNF